MSSIPKHIAVIMDGNGRWAAKRGIAKEEGHKQGMETAKKIAKASRAQGIEYLTLYAFSSENWRRPGAEVTSLMDLLNYYLLYEADNLIRDDIRLTFIGDRSKLAQSLQELMKKAEDASKGNKFHLIMAISYGARDEIRQTALDMARYVIENRVNTNQVNPYLFDEFINKGIPDPDLLIRTGGECRISNFLLWQIAYTELYFTDKLWPDFEVDDLMQAIFDFSKRERRYGKRDTESP